MPLGATPFGQAVICQLAISYTCNFVNLQLCQLAILLICYFADVKVRLEKRNHFYYPDIIVTCDDRDRETATYKSFPKLIIEVLSDSTEAFDRGDKFNDYQTLESLEEYVLVNSKHQRVETFRRGEQGLWILQTYQQESFSLQSINLTASFRDLYEDVTLETVNYSVEEIE